MNRIMVSKGFQYVAVAWVAMTFVTSHVNAEGPLYASTKVARQPGKVYWHTDFNAGWAEAKQKNLPMVIFITSDHCTYCDAMKRNTWCNSKIQSRVSKDFVAIELKPSRNAKTLSRINVRVYPTTLVGVPAGKVVAHRQGYQPPQALDGLLAEAEKSNITQLR